MTVFQIGLLREEQVVVMFSVTVSVRPMVLQDSMMSMTIMTSTPMM